MVPRTKKEPGEVPGWRAPVPGSKVPVAVPAKPSSKLTMTSFPPSTSRALGRAGPPKPAPARSRARRLRAGTTGTVRSASAPGSVPSSTALTEA